MKYKKHGLILSGILTLVLVASISSKNPVAANGTIGELVSSETLTTVYNINDTFTVPSDAKIKYNGVEYTPTNTFLTYPNGNNVKGKSFTLDAYGEYKAIYEAEIEAAHYIYAEQTFKVSKDLYNFAMDGKSTMDYGDLYMSFVNKGYPKGLVLQMADGDTFSVAKPINIFSQEVFEILSFNCVCVQPNVKNVNIRLTDCYDPNIYMDITYKRGTYAYEAYVVAGSNGSGLIGLNESPTGTIAIDQTLYDVSSTGTVVPGAWEQNNNINDLTFFIDSSNKDKLRVYASTDQSYVYRLVREFNNSSISASTFGGFTNGNVYLSITASSFSGVTHARVEVAKLNGVTGKNLLPTEYYFDTNAPLINIDAPNQTNEILGGFPIKVPTATVLDDTAVRGSYDYTVWYNYDSALLRRTVTTSKDSNGNTIFTPSLLGNYVVEYKATDVYGNKAIALLRLTASQMGNKPFAFNCIEVPSGSETGSLVSFNNYTVKSISGSCTVKAKITLPNGTIEEINDLTKDYLLEQVGAYKVSYLLSDAFYEDSYTYTFNTVSGTTPIFEKNYIPTPNYYISNGIYSLENINANLYTSEGKKAQSFNAYVKYDGGEYTNVGFSAKSFSVRSADEVSTIQFKLEVANKPEVYIESQVCQVVDCEYQPKISLAPEKYFQGTFVGERKGDAITYTANGLSGDTGYLNFVNRISLSNFVFMYQIPKLSNFGTMKLKITDYYNRDNSIQIGLSSSNVIQINNEDPSLLTLDWKNTDEKITISYNATTEALTFGSNSFPIPNTFVSDLCLLEISFTGLDSNSTISIAQICNQPMSETATTDLVKPILTVKIPNKISNKDGISYAYRPYFCDMLSPSPDSKCTMSVLKDGEAVTSIDGVNLASLNDFSRDYYEFKTSDYGTYTLTYEYADGANRKSTKQTVVNVIDTVPPVLTLSKTSDTQKAGESVPCIAYTVTDNVSKPENITVWFVAYDQYGRLVSSALPSKGMAIREAGEYLVYVFAYDEAGNTAHATYQLTCK